MPTKYGIFKAYGYVNKISGEHHVALVKGEIGDGEPVLCRVHSECLTGDAFGSLRCDCGEQLAEALRRIEKAGRGVLLYMRQEGRGIGLINKLKAYHLQDGGMDTVEANLALGFKADLREYGTGAEILADLGVKRMILMTNNPLKIKGLDGFGLEVVGREPIEMTCNEKNEFYMYTKYKKMGHILHVRNEADIVSVRQKIEKEKKNEILTIKDKNMNLLEGKLLAEGQKVGIVAARFNEFITSKLLGGAVDAFVRHGGDEAGLDVAWVPGAFEVPLIAKKMAASGKYDAVICLGAVIRGATPHFDMVANEATKGVAQVGLQTGVPVIFGILTTDSIEQAVERAGTKAGNKGFEAMTTAIEMINLLKTIG